MEYKDSMNNGTRCASAIKSLYRYTGTPDNFHFQ